MPTAARRDFLWRFAEDAHSPHATDQIACRTPFAREGATARPRSDCPPVLECRLQRGVIFSGDSLKTRIRRTQLIRSHVVLLSRAKARRLVLGPTVLRCLNADCSAA